ncbi:hypothetical protein Q31a_42070 [Aureliella helgolandensis]|uniref:Uncharacterized protein n=1 Tax=Aureliella helgolandensis TaxID=2527968 RepID=A0A518GBC4_9BACT|nr:hypothetical protein Q31a_42070 [Aureliella helgolandensis]
MDDRRIEGRGGWMLSSLERMVAKTSPQQAALEFRRIRQLNYSERSWRSLTIAGMVAFAHSTETHFKTSPYARGQDRSYTGQPSLRANSTYCSDLRKSVYAGSARLVTCSKDPIGYYLEEDLYYEYGNANPATNSDPLGLLAWAVGTCGGCAACLGPAVYYCGTDADCWKLTWQLMPRWHKWACSGACGGCGLILGRRVAVAVAPWFKPPRIPKKRRCPKPKCSDAYKLGQSALVHAVCDQPRSCKLRGRSGRCDWSLTPEQMLAPSAIS